MKITIDNRDFAFTIDTYNMFSGDSVEEGESEYYQETFGLTEEEWRTIGFDYDMKAITKELAGASVNILEQELKGDVVKSISLISEQSPRFYNYTTDSYTATWDIDAKALNKYVEANVEAYKKLQAEEWPDLDPDSEEDLYIARLDFYTREVLEEESYNMWMWEREGEIYLENMKLDKESQELIDTKKEIE